MARDRIIDCIGASDEDIAHLRLMLRTATHLLRDTWYWGTEDKADIVIVNAHSLIGDSALRRSQQRGISYAQLIEAGDNAPDWHFLRKPLRREEVVDLLNGIGASSIAPMTILSQGDDFFEMDLGEHEEHEVPSGDFEQRLHSAHARLRGSEAEPEHDAIDAIFRRDPLAHKPEFLMPDKLAHGVGVEYVHGTTERSASRADSSGDPFSRKGLSAESIDPTFRHDIVGSATDNQKRPLSAYLDQRLLGGPARIELPRSAALVLDPKEQVFHAQGSLLSLEGYCCQPLRLGDWVPIVSAELAALRERMPARPYVYLRWMDRYLNSNGYLASHLDPAGTYRLTRRLALAQDFSFAARVGSEMLSPLRLDEIARASEVSLADVFDVVNAYEAIGYVEWKHRVRAPR
ncbi:MAG TPA: hypothetical protein VGT79_00715 [Xanthomonadaceae bacterium]|nr:hypothetical protein [Xanthomonadaceae bacterium]